MSSIKLKIIFTLIILFLFQACIDKKLIYHPQKIDKDKLLYLKTNNNYKEIEFNNDGIKLRGWLIKNHNYQSAPLIIYFGGNAEEVSSQVYFSKYLTDCSILAINYRSYGESQGKVSQKNLFKDALFIYDEIKKKEEYQNKKIISMGKSLGSGVAVYLASQRELDGVILSTPFDSLKKVAKEYYPSIIVNSLLHENFNSIKKVDEINSKLLMLVAENDRIIPFERSNELFKAWKGKKDLKVIALTNHNTIPNSLDYWDSINKFIDSF